MQDLPEYFDEEDYDAYIKQRARPKPERRLKRSHKQMKQEVAARVGVGQTRNGDMPHCGNGGRPRYPAWYSSWRRTHNGLDSSSSRPFGVRSSSP